MAVDMKKYTVPVVAGVMGGMIVQAFVEKAIHGLYPPSAGMELHKVELVKAYLQQLPTTAYVYILVNYAVCAALGGVVATLLAGRVDGVSKTSTLVVGALMAIAGIINVMSLPFQPLWFSVVSILLPVPLSFIGYKLSSKK